MLYDCNIDYILGLTNVPDAPVRVRVPFYKISDKIKLMRLKYLRLMADMTQKEVADKLNLSQVAYGYYERYDRLPSTETLIKLVKIFNCSTDYLLNVTEDLTPFKREEVIFPEKVIHIIDTKKLKEVRLQMKMTQLQVATFLGCTPEAYGNYERGNRRFPEELLQKLTKLCCCSVEELCK